MHGSMTLCREISIHFLVQTSAQLLLKAENGQELMELSRSLQFSFWLEAEILLAQHHSVYNRNAQFLHS
jgi:hypothetical protein